MEENSAACESEPAAAVRRRPSGQLQKRPAAAQYRGSSILVRRLAVRHIYIQRHMLRAHVGNCRQPGCSRQQSPGHSCCCRRCKLPPSTRGSCRSGRVCSPTAATSAAVASGIAVACARQVTDTRPGVFGDNPCCPAPLLRSLW